MSRPLSSAPGGPVADPGTPSIASSVSLGSTSSGDGTDDVGPLSALGAALDAGGDAIVVVARGTRRLLWCNTRCATLHPALVGGAPGAAVPGLDAWLDELEGEGASEPFTLSRSDRVDGGTAGGPVSGPVGDAVDETTTERANGPSNGPADELFHRASLAHLDDRHLVLRFSPDATSGDYLRRYVADREKLFMVSRSVSVSEMATTLAHELNQPIGAIANLLQALHVTLARGPEPVPEPVRRTLSRASDQTRFAAGIIARIRSFTESRAPRLVECEIGGLLNDTIELLDWVFRSEGVEVSLERGTAPLVVSGDEILLQQVFVNLLRNAVDAMRDRPRDERFIAVVAARTADGIGVDISDTGEGLGEDADDTLFVPFLTKKSDGMGVGLNICRSFVEMHRGKLWLAPARGGGCTAHVSLPERTGERDVGHGGEDGRGAEAAGPSGGGK